MKTLFNFIPRLAWTFSNKNPFRFLYLLLRLYWFAITRKFLSTVFTKNFCIAGVFNKRPIKIYLRRAMEIAVLVEVFVDEEYAQDLPEVPKVIFDLGAHIGETALYYHAVYPNARIIAVEPEPGNFERVRQNVAGIDRIETIQAAVGAEDSEIDFYLGVSSLGYSTIKRDPDDTVITVTQMSLAKLFEKTGVEKADLIKFDIEGAEFQLFESIQSKQVAKNYIGEMHYKLTDIHKVDEVSTLVGAPVNEVRLLFGERYMIKF